MSDQSLFQAPQEGGTPQTPASTDPFADLLSSVKNERGEQKYKDIPSAFEGLRNAQEFIPQLKQQLDSYKAEIENLKAELNKRAGIEDVLSKLTASQNQSQPAAGVDQEQVLALVRQAVENTLTVRESEATKNANITTVVSTIKEKYGDKSEEVFYAKASQLGLSRDEMNRLAAQNPKVVLQLFDAPRQSVDPFPFLSKDTTASLQDNKQQVSLRNEKSVLFGATTEDFRAEAVEARKMVEDLNAKGISAHDLSDPKMYFKVFGKTK